MNLLSNLEAICFVYLLQIGVKVGIETRSIMIFFFFTGDHINPRFATREFTRWRAYMSSVTDLLSLARSGNGELRLMARRSSTFTDKKNSVKATTDHLVC